MTREVRYILWDGMGYLKRSSTSGGYRNLKGFEESE